MTTIIRDYKYGETIPDAIEDRGYTYEELDGAVFIHSDDITGAETYRLGDGTFAILQSIDLDWVEPEAEKILRTTSLRKGN